MSGMDIRIVDDIFRPQGLTVGSAQCMVMVRIVQITATVKVSVKC